MVEMSVFSSWLRRIEETKAIFYLIICLYRYAENNLRHSVRAHPTPDRHLPGVQYRDVLHRRPERKGAVRVHLADFFGVLRVGAAVCLRTESVLRIAR